jgi:hypothetical protein
MTRRPRFILILAALSAFPLPAATVSFMVMETGLGESRELNNASILWENTVLDAFFEAGHIVSNAPMLRVPGPASPAGTGAEMPEAAREGFEGAREGGADYFILVHLDYPGAGDRNQRPRDVSLRLFRVRPRAFIAEERLGEEKARSAGTEAETLKSTVRKLMPYMKNER